MFVSCLEKKQNNITIQAASVQASDGLDLQAVGQMVKKAKNAEDLEKMINVEGGPNNLDLDEDSETDYLNVQGYGEGNARGFSIFVNMTETETQEVASIEIEKAIDGSAQVYTTGNEQIYGANHSYYSNYRASDFILMAYLFSPSWSPYYHRPYYRGYYPSYYRAYHPVSRTVYRTRTKAITKTSTVKRTSAKNPAPKRKSNITSPNKGKSSSKIKATLNNPTKSQKSFQAKNPSKTVKTGGFGNKNKNKSKTTRPKTTQKKKSSWGGSSSSRRSSGSRRKSDVKWKKNIRPLNNSVNKVMALRGVSYDWRVSEFPNQNFSEEACFGFIAQDVEKVIPEAIYTDENGNKEVYYQHMIAYLVEVVKYQQKMLKQQEKDIDILYELQNVHTRK